MSWEVEAPPWEHKEAGPALSMMVQLWNSKAKPLGWRRRRRRGRPRTWPSTFQRLMENTDSTALQGMYQCSHQQLDADQKAADESNVRGESH